MFALACAVLCALARATPHTHAPKNHAPKTTHPNHAPKNHAPQTRRDVEEKSEQLKAVSNLAALIAGFALVAFLQFDWSEAFVDRSGALLPLFAATMALTVGFETVCVIVCTLMLASIYKPGQGYRSEQVRAAFFWCWCCLFVCFV